MAPLPSSLRWLWKLTKLASTCFVGAPRATFRCDATRHQNRRTRQCASERVLNELDINDYWPKTEITPHRMRTILTGLIRSYRDIVELREQQVLLQQMRAKLFQQERSRCSASWPVVSCMISAMCSHRSPRARQCSGACRSRTRGKSGVRRLNL